jgi:1,4-dihydroxy-2-naphthoyl-CoA hydrolase
MFTHRMKVRLQDTDATGVLYFSEQFKMALEVFEEFLHAHGYSLKKLMQSPFLMPVVHAEADYFAPLEVGDELEISLVVEQLGTSSITFSYRFFDSSRQLEVGQVKIVHVTMERQSKKAVPIPDFLRTILEAVPTGKLPPGV